MQNKVKVWYFSIISLFAVVVLAVFSVIYPNEGLSFNRERSVSWNEGWYLRTDKGELSSISLPAKIEADINEEYTIVRTLPKILPDNSTMCIRTSQQSLAVYCNGTLLYKAGHNFENYIGTSAGCFWNIIRIPNECAGKQLELTFISTHSIYAGTINSINFGTKSSLMYFIFEKYIVEFLFEVLLFLIGIILLIFYLYIRKSLEAAVNLLYLSGFSVWISLWLIGESHMLQFFFDNHFIITNISFITYAIFPIPMMLYLDSECHFKDRWYPRFTLISLSINLFMSVFLQAAKIMDFFRFITYSSMLMFFLLVLTTFFLFREVYIYHNPDSRRIAAINFMIIVFSFIDLFNFFSGNMDNIGHFLKIGLFVYILSLGIMTLKKISLLLEQNRERQYLETLAYQDIMTHTFNRAAFYRDIEEKFKGGYYSENLGLLMMDINDLKQINDNFGHPTGDRAILDCSNCIKKSFNSLGSTYRIGGDEFACIINSTCHDEVNTAIIFFQQLVAEIAQSRSYPFSVAVGYSKMHDLGGNSFDDLMCRVDRYLYENKRQMKQKSDL